jgi:hypothetical protein
MKTKRAICSALFMGLIMSGCSSKPAGPKRYASNPSDHLPDGIEKAFLFLTPHRDWGISTLQIFWLKPGWEPDGYRFIGGSKERPNWIELCEDIASQGVRRDDPAAFLAEQGIEPGIFHSATLRLTAPCRFTTFLLLYYCKQQNVVIVVGDRGDTWLPGLRLRKLGNESHGEATQE